MTLELGGKSPQVVFADADLGLAASCIATSILANAGQACVAGTRLIAAREIAEPLLEKIAARLACIRPGPTWETETAYAPIISERQIGRIESLVGAALSAGAQVAGRRAAAGAAGFFYAPTILDHVAPGSPAVIEEIFGPVLTTQTFSDEAEAVALADHPSYGLCAGLYTRDLSRAVRVTRQLQAGTIWVNRYGRFPRPHPAHRWLQGLRHRQGSRPGGLHGQPQGEKRADRPLTPARPSSKLRRGTPMLDTRASCASNASSTVNGRTPPTAVRSR